MNIRSDRHQPGVVMLGDSVGNQVFEPFRINKPNRFGVLTSNQAIEMPGHYYTLMRYLQNRKPPHAVIFMGLPPLGFNLSQPTTENYVQRCFTQWHEILELTAAKRNAVFGMKMVLYKLLPSYKYRLHLQSQLTGSANADIYAGINPDANRATSERGGREHRIFRILQRFIDGGRARSIADDYMARLIEELGKRNIAFYYVPAPVPESASGPGQDVEDTALRMKEFQRQYSNCVFMEELQLAYPKERFVDRRHLAAEGLRLVHEKLDGFLWEVESGKRPEWRTTGEPL